MQLLHETRLPVNKLSKRLGVNNSTLYRWWRRGLKGVHLETFVEAGTRYTTEEAYERFVERHNSIIDGKGSEAKPSVQRQASISQAERELASAGI